MAAAAPGDPSLDQFMRAQLQQLPAQPSAAPPPDPLDSYMQQQLSAPTAPRGAGGLPPVLPGVGDMQPIAPGTPPPPPDPHTLPGGGPPTGGQVRRANTAPAPAPRHNSVIPGGLPSAAAVGSIFADIAPPPAAPAVPAVTHLQYAPHPEETALHQIDHSLDTLPAFIHAPGYHIAEGGPVRRLQGQQQQAAAALGEALPRLEKEWRLNEQQLQQQREALNRYAVENHGGLDAGQLTALRQRMQALTEAFSAQEARRSQLLGYYHRINPEGPTPTPPARPFSLPADPRHVSVHNIPTPALPADPRHVAVLPGGVRSVEVPSDLPHIIEAGKQVLGFGLRAITKGDDWTNAYLNSLGKAVNREGPGALLDSRTHATAATAGRNALTDWTKPTPPSFVRQTLGLHPGQAGRLPYDAAAVADYLISGVLAPSNLFLGPVFEKAGGPLRGALGKVTGPLIERTGAAIEKQAPSFARAAAVTGEALGVGPSAALQRAVSTPLRHELATRLTSAAQIAREAAAETIRLRRFDPAFDVAERAWAEQHGGASRLQDALSMYVYSPKGGLAVAKGHGLDPAIVQQFGDRILAHADETAASLERNGVVPPGTYTRPGAARSTFLQQYTEQVFRHPAAAATVNNAVTTAAHGGVAEVKQAAVHNMLSAVAADPAQSALITPGSSLRPGWEALPADARYGALAGRQVAGPIARFVKATVTPTRIAGEPSPTEQFGKLVAGWWLKGTQTGKQLTLNPLLNPGGLLSSVGARLAAAEVAAERAGGATPGAGKLMFAKVLQAGPAAAREWAVFLRTGKQSPDIAAFVKESPSFLSHFGTQVEPGPAGVAQIAGTGGKILRAGSRSAYVPSGNEALQNFLGSGGYSHGAADQLVKLAAWKAFRGKLGDAGAARLIERHLFDYGDQGALLELANKYGVAPFNAFPVKATQLFLHTLVERPDLIARYPRLQQMLKADVPGAQPGYENLAPYQKGPNTLPLGGNQFAGVGRYNVFGEALEALDPKPPGEADGRNLGDLLAGHVLAGPALDILLENRSSMTGRPIVPPGTPPDVAAQMRNAALLRAAPGTGRALSLADRVKEAATGQPNSPSRSGEAKTPAAVASQYALGVPLYKGEPEQGKLAREKPILQARGAAFRGLVGTLRSPAGTRDLQPQVRTYLRDLGTDRRTLARQAKDAGTFLRSQALAANNYTARGEITPEGRDRITKGYAQLLALQARLRALPRAQP